GEIDDSPVLMCRVRMRSLGGTGSTTVTLTDATVNSVRGSDQTLNLWVGEESITTVGISGGTATGPGGLTLTFPAGAVISNTPVSVEKLALSSLPIEFPPMAEFTPTTMAWKLGPDMEFRRPVNFKVDYTDADLSTASESLLMLFWLDPSVNKWVRQNGSVDAASNVFTATITHFSYFVLAADTMDTPHIRITRLNARPNPFSPNNDNKNDLTTISFHISRDAKEATLKVFDVNGRLIRLLFEKLALFKGENQFEWDGKNGYGDTMATGIYIYYLGVRDNDNRLDEASKTVVISRHMKD
ncbi:MAG: gliding motility-associated C-terminal domain-containing protein, partial [Candidatus Wallbacteria bacterium]|nr:gliding motility-associated C-terminal domain-containing protein [Candidatus Wallbacteria bacterium]